ncbi:hypothetical protein [Nereida ignava]|uniref:hypothetical protein n=1 Tax=Nereida ignava TaxID=282199 RepID=UPI0030F97CF0
MANIDINEIRHTKLEDSKTWIGPTLASMLMDNNQGNRSFRIGHAKDIARQMKLGRWKASPEPIVITTRGRVVNGQHRLWAVVDTGTTQEFSIIVIPDEQYKEIFEILDQGATRSSADVLREDTKNITPINYLLRVSGIKTVKHQDIRPFIDSDLGRIIKKMNDRKPAGKIWKHNLFKAAMAISILDGVISEDEAFDIYDNLLTTTITSWPHVFGLLYMQLTDGSIPLNSSGRSVHNDWFIRTMFALKNRNNTNLKMIRIYKNTLVESEACILRVLTKINPHFLATEV